MKELEEKIKVFGKIDQLEVIADEVHIKITDGFDMNGLKTFECMKIICEHLPEYPMVRKCKTDKNLFHMILRK